VAPLIIATDKTQLTYFVGGKSAYPVYLTLGNLPKSVRRRPSLHGSVLIGYLPTDKIPNPGNKLTANEHRARTQRLFHDSMRLILAPLATAGREGVEMTCGDGAVRHVFPLLAAYVADFPEQCLVTCSKYGTCPKCQCPSDKLGLPDVHPERTQGWTLSVIEDALRTCTTNGSFHAKCMEQDVSGSVHCPFWADFPLCDIHAAITPDVLHQLYQGVFKHLLSWCQRLLSKTEFDLRIASLAPAFGVRHFAKGISGISQMSGTERKQIAKVLLACLVGRLPQQGLDACRGLMDFIYLAQYPSHSETTLQYMEDALELFHHNKQFFIDFNIRDGFNIPKFHSLLHYVSSIRLLGTTDNYNTEAFERLHIDFAKKGWQASNKKDEFPQMIAWMTRQEKMWSFQTYIDSLDGSLSESTVEAEDTYAPATKPSISIAKHPHKKSKPLSAIELYHDAPGFSYHVKDFLNNLTPHPGTRSIVSNSRLPFQHLEVFHHFRFSPSALHDDSIETDAVKAIPRTLSSPGRFDTVVVLRSGAANTTGTEGTRIGRVKVVFRLPQTDAPAYWPADPLAYIEWYTPMRPTPDKTNGMFSMKKATPLSSTKAIPGSVVPLQNIRQSCMLTPKFSAASVGDEDDWNSDNILDKCKTFLLNNWQSMYTYQTLY